MANSVIWFVKYVEQHEPSYIESAWTSEALAIEACNSCNKNRHPDEDPGMFIVTRLHING